ncbi:MAG: molybdopterin molybdotransferase MoeA [Hydrotalea sp.]|nr:molybdopterin molybdotransferase MoeA [Hydrotalea sp.]
MVQLNNDCFATGGNNGLLTLAQALARLEKNLGHALAKKPLAKKTMVKISEAVGRVAAVEVWAKNPVPHFANSAVDGFAFRLADVVAMEKELEKAMEKNGAAKNLSVTLPVVGAIAANPRPGLATLPPRQAVQIFTGAPMPKNADSVVMIEDVAVTPDKTPRGNKKPDDNKNAAMFITLPANMAGKFHAGDNVRRAGDDVARGQMLLARGDIITPLHVGLLAAQDIQQVAVFTALRVGVFSSGDEIKSSATANHKLKIGEIFDSNRPMIIALLRAWGYDAVDGGVLPDDEPIMIKKMTAVARRTDVIITSGGMAVGDYDMAAGLIKKSAMQFCGVAMKPGRPIGFGTIGGKQWLAMPGNPVAVMMGMFFLIKPFLGLLQGRGRMVVARPSLAVVDFAMKKKPGRREWLRVKCRQENTGENDGLWRATKIAKTGSAVLSSLSEADGIVALAEDVTTIAAGDRLPFYPIEQLLGH